MSRQQLVDRQRKERLWEQKQMHNGHMAQVVAYRNAQDIDVLIDNRITVEHTTYQTFKKGSMTPGYPKKQHSHIGETVLMHNGLTAEIIAYRCVGDRRAFFRRHYSRA